MPDTIGNVKIKIDRVLSYSPWPVEVSTTTGVTDETNEYESLNEMMMNLIVEVGEQQDVTERK